MKPALVEGIVTDSKFVTIFIIISTLEVHGYDEKRLLKFKFKLISDRRAEIPLIPS